MTIPRTRATDEALKTDREILRERERREARAMALPASKPIFVAAEDEAYTNVPCTD